jgi:hypothetical protein
MFVKSKKEFVLAQAGHWTVGRKHDWQFVVDRDGQMLEGFLTATLSDPESKFSNGCFKATLVSI